MALTVAAAQTVPGLDVAANVDDHVRLIGVAARHGAQLVLFPEMSLTGYLREGAQALAFCRYDRRLQPIIHASRHAGCVAIVGAPLTLEDRLYIGSFVVHPDSTVQIYTKQFLHDGEEACFDSRTDLDPHPHLGADLLSLAICADITHSEHAANAARARTSLYAASIFYSVRGVAEAHATLSAYSGGHAFVTVMSNFGGTCWGMEAGGHSAVWDESGRLVSACEHPHEGLVLARRREGAWTGEEIATNR
jgi:predicted amidohydrolase